MQITKLVPKSKKVYKNNTYSDIVGVRLYRVNVVGTIVLLNDVLYSLQVRRNLLFVYVLTRKWFGVHFILGKLTIGKHGLVMFEGKYVKEHRIFNCNEINKTYHYVYINYVKCDFEYVTSALRPYKLKKIKHLIQ